MNNDITVTLKTPGELKGRQATKGKKTGNDDVAFGQALASASAGTSDYRDNSVETTPRQTKQGTSREASETAVGDEGVSAVTPEALAEKMQTVQTSQFIRSILKGEETPAEGLPEELVPFPMEMAMMEQGDGKVTEAVSLADVDVSVMVNVAGATGQVEVLDDVRVVDALEGIQAAGIEMVQPEETEEVAAAKQKPDGTLAADVMAEPGAAVQTDGQVHKQEDGETKEDELKVSEVKTESHAAGNVDMTYTQRTAANQAVQSESHVTPSGEIREEYVDMLNDMIARQISQGKQELEISLTPRSLGKLIVKVAIEAGETTVSIICTNEKAMHAMSQKAGELGRMLEDSLGTKMEVVVDTEKPDSYLQQDGRNASQEQADQEQKGSQGQQKDREADTADFLQQLRLGLA